MVGPVAYEASVPFFTKALRSQLKLLEKAQDWASTNNLDQSKMIAGTLATDMSVRNPHLNEKPRRRRTVSNCTDNITALWLPCRLLHLQRHAAPHRPQDS